MATITLTVPTDKVTRFLAATSYKSTIPDPDNVGQTIPNPITATAHSKNWILQVVKDQILRYEAEVARTTAVETAMTQDLSDII